MLLGMLKSVNHISLIWNGRQLKKSLDKKFDGYLADVVNYDHAIIKSIVWISNERSPSKYFLYDFKTKELKKGANPFPWINEKQMSHMKPITYKTRDGLTIHAYLTLPFGVNAKNFPVIINPHGRPWA